MSNKESLKKAINETINTLTDTNSKVWALLEQAKDMPVRCPSAWKSWGKDRYEEAKFAAETRDDYIALLKGMKGTIDHSDFSEVRKLFLQVSKHLLELDGWDSGDTSGLDEFVKKILKEDK